MDANRLWLGIDFSGDASRWTRGCNTSNVWIAEVSETAAGLVLHSLKRVQQLEGDHEPFNRLANLLKSGAYAAAAIDAPFSVPLEFVSRGHKTLLESVNRIPRSRRPFPFGEEFVEAIAGSKPPLAPPKPLRKTEAAWQTLGVNVRSTLWVKPRGGAPMTAACLTLLSIANRALWPWTEACDGILVEAFPAAQLHHWGLPFVGYNGSEPAAEGARRRIVARLAERVSLENYRQQMVASADALDAVICAFAAIAVSEGRVALSPKSFDDEGWISVHSK